MQKKILGFTGNRAELFIQTELFIYLSKVEEIDFELLAYNDMKDSVYSSQIEKLRSLGVIILDDLNGLEPQVTNDKHSGSILLIMETVAKKIKRKYDLAIVYADRYESFGFTVAMFHHKVPILHIEAGDITQGGTMDDSIRHAISRLSSLFSTTTQNAHDFLVDGREEEWRMNNSGLLSYSRLLRDDVIEASQQITNWNRINTANTIIICTMHSRPQAIDKGYADAKECIDAVVNLGSNNPNIAVIITSPNADDGGDKIQSYIDNLRVVENIKVIRSLGLDYYYLLKQSANKKIVLIGNSSSIIKEAPFFNCFHVNVGKRQSGRLSASSQQNVEGDSKDIYKLLTDIVNEKKNQPEIINNPYMISGDPVKVLVEWLIYILNNKSKEELLIKKWV